MKPRSAPVKGVSPRTSASAGTEPTPTNTRKAVPRNSAASFCHSLFSSSMKFSFELGDVEQLSTMSNMIRRTRSCQGESPNRLGSTNGCREGGDAVIQSIDRAARILSSLQGARHLGITELAGELDLPPSTIHGLVKSLQEHGLV